MWLLLRNTHFLFVTSTSATKSVSFNLGYFKYFWGKHCELLPKHSLWSSLTGSQLCLSWFIANTESNMFKMLLEIGSSRPAVFYKNEILLKLHKFHKSIIWSHWCFRVNMFQWMDFFIFASLFQKRQKQPPEMFCGKRCSQNFYKFLRKIPVLELLLNKIAGF